MTDAHQLTMKSPKMLIADDDPSVVRLLADRCACVGFEIETAVNGVQALIKAVRSPPDVMVIDVNMPEADGLAVCARLLEPSRRSLNAVVVIGSRGADTVERCEGLGACYVRKGPGFWNGFGVTLTGLFPSMAEQIKGLQQQPAGAEIRERPLVLVIDDDFTIMKFFSSRLDKCGVELLFASDITQGYRIAYRERPSIIISDYFLPNGGVPDLLSRLRTTPATQNIPVFVLTGRNLDEITQQSLMREVCGKPGVVRIFVKAFDTDELFAALQMLCGFEYNRMGA
jgi:CheY-like chemotaxis protein